MKLKIQKSSHMISALGLWDTFLLQRFQVVRSQGEVKEVREVRERSG